MLKTKKQLLTVVIILSWILLMTGLNCLMYYQTMANLNLMNNLLYSESEPGESTIPDPPVAYDFHFRNKYGRFNAIAFSNLSVGQTYRVNLTFEFHQPQPIIAEYDVYNVTAISYTAEFYALTDDVVFMFNQQDFDPYNLKRVYLYLYQLEYGFWILKLYYISEYP